MMSSCVFMRRDSSRVLCILGKSAGSKESYYKMDSDSKSGKTRLYQTTIARIPRSILYAIYGDVLLRHQSSLCYSTLPTQLPRSIVIISTHHTHNEHARAF